jgi:hypothetical protein
VKILFAKKLPDMTQRGELIERPLGFRVTVALPF